MSITVYNSFLVLHVIGITVMAGTSLIDFLTFRSLKKVLKIDTATSRTIEDSLDKLQRYLGIGMLLILVSGIGMMIKLHEVWGVQIWFKIKMGILLIIIINGLGLRRMLGAKLKKALAAPLPTGSKGSIETISSNLTIVQILQLLLFIVIYTLSIFKFN